MVFFNDEPPRTKLMRHYTFDLRKDGGAIDLSPRGVNANPRSVDFDQSAEGFETFTETTDSESVTSLSFSSDGGYLHVADKNNVIHSYFTSNYGVDVFDSDEDGTFDASSEVSTVENVAVSEDGTKMFITDNDSVYSYTLSTAHNVSSASYDGTSYQLVDGGDLRGMSVADGGSRLYAQRAGTSVPNYYQYSMGTAWDLATISEDKSIVTPDDNDRTNIEGLNVTLGGTEMYVVHSDNKVTRYLFDTPYDIATAGFDDDYRLSSSTHTSPVDIDVAPELYGYGQFYVADDSEHIIQEHEFPDEMRVQFGDIGRASGAVGSAADFDGGSLNIGNLGDGIEQFTFSFWIYVPEDLDQRNSENERQTILQQLGISKFGVVTIEEDQTIGFDKPGGFGKLTSNDAVPTGEWTHVIVEYDNPERTIYINQMESASDSGPDSTITINDATLGRGGAGVNSTTVRIDDPRIYFDTFDESYRDALYAVGNEHQSTETLGNSWPSLAMPYRGGNVRFGATLAETHDWLFRDLDSLLQSRFVDTAAGPQLERIGRGYGVMRKENESVDKYRARIKAELAAGRSSGTFKDIIRAAATILNTDIGRLELNYVSPATAQILVPNSVLDNTPLTTTEITNILKDVVVAGHDIEVVESVTNPFTLKDLGTGDDADLGLISDSNSTGGKLVSDV